MKGIMIYEAPFWGDEENAVYTHEVTNASYTLNQVGCTDITCHLEGTATKGPVTKAVCNKDDTYDFETGALISLMKMCGLEKSAKAYAEIFDDTAYGDALIERDKLERELIELKKDFDKVRELKDFYKKNYNERLEEIKSLKEKNAELLGAKSCLNYFKSCNESTIESLENTRDLLINKNNELIEENKRLKAEKVLSWKNYQRKIQKKQDRINELEAQITASEDDKQKNIEYYEKEIKKLRGFLKLSEEENEELKKNINELFESEQHSKSELGRLYFEKHRLEEEVEKLKLDCEKLQHSYNNMIICGGRQNGKQYTFLVDLFKKIDQKKVDEAYKEAYEKWTKQSVWQLDSLLEAGKYAIPYTTAWIKPPTKREKMWEKIFALHKKNNVIIVVEKEDVNAFLHEIENRIPEIRWASWQKIFEARNTIKDIYEALKTCDRVYFRLRKEDELSYSSDPDIYQYRDLEHISYLPPMRWDLFEKGRLAVKVNFDNYKEFYEACKKELGKRPLTNFACIFTVSICKDDGFFEIFTVEDQKKTGRKIVDWEDVR